jgi:hypothetical protein
VDPISLLLMAQSAVSAISAGCQMLREGKAEIGKFKKQIEGGVADAKAIYKEVTGIWGWIQGLLGTAPKPVERAVVQPAKPDATLINEGTKKQKRRTEPEPELSYEEYQARSVHEICENLKVYFEAMRALKAHCQELEEQSLTTDKVADSAIDRIEIQWQMHQLSAQLKQAMIYGTPRELGLGAMYEDFLVKYDEIVEAQEVARAVKARNERDKAWQRELLKHHRIDRALTAAAVLVLVAWMWGIALSLAWLVRTPAGLSSLLSF